MKKLMLATWLGGQLFISGYFREHTRNLAIAGQLACRGSAQQSPLIGGLFALILPLSVLVADDPLVIEYCRKQR